MNYPEHKPIRTDVFHSDGFTTEVHYYDNKNDPERLKFEMYEDIARMLASDWVADDWQRPGFADLLRGSPPIGGTVTVMSDVDFFAYVADGPEPHAVRTNGVDRLSFSHPVDGDQYAFQLDGGRSFLVTRKCRLRYLHDPSRSAPV